MENIKNKMVDDLKRYCEEQINGIKHGYDPHQAVTRAYGAVMFFLSVFPDDEEYEGIGWWWDNECHPRFYELGAY